MFRTIPFQNQLNVEKKVMILQSHNENKRKKRDIIDLLTNNSSSETTKTKDHFKLTLLYMTEYLFDEFKVIKELHTHPHRQFCFQI